MRFSSSEALLQKAFNKLLKARELTPADVVADLFEGDPEQVGALVQSLFRLKRYCCRRPGIRWTLLGLIKGSLTLSLSMSVYSDVVGMELDWESCVSLLVETHLQVLRRRDVIGHYLRLGSSDDFRQLATYLSHR